MHGKHILSVAKNAELGYTYQINRSNERNEETTVKTHDFWYHLPEELIAQTPLEKRDTSRLMCLNRETGEVNHKFFYDIISID